MSAPASPSPPADAGAAQESQRRAERRQAIVERAARRFADIGYADCDMGNLAKDLGIAKGTLYLYFPSKEELFIQERASFKHRKQPTFFNYREQIRGRWRAVYLQLQQQGRIRSDVPVERMLEIVGNLLYGTMFTNHFAGRQISLDEQHAAVMAIIYRGLLP